MPSSRIIRGLTICVLLVLLNACATPNGAELQPTPAEGGAVLAAKLEQELRASYQISDSPAVEPAPSSRPQRSVVVSGSREFINPRAARPPEVLETLQGDVTLNFELADIRDVVKVIFDTLGQNYILDPAVQGEVTVQTSRPLPRDLLLPTLETLLRQVGAALVRSEGSYRIVPVGGAVAGSNVPRLGRTGPGYAVRIFPLRYISAVEMETILQPFAPAGGVLMVDPIRNLLILGGTRQELNYLQETIDIFDVNWLRGMSVGLYPLANVDAQDMTNELSRLFGPDSGLPFAGLFRFVPITRMNAVLVITPQPEYLNEATVWIERLDESGGERLYVYKVQNSDADYLASLIGNIFDTTTGSGTRPSTSGRVAPGLQPGQIATPPGGGINLASFQAIDEEQLMGRQPQAAAPVGGGSGPTDNTRIIADVENNALLIWASAQQYERMLGALRQIDVPKRQVLIEATIAEVTLTDELSYGLQWFFKNDVGRFGGLGSLNLAPGTPVGDVNFSNFTYALADAGGIVRALLNVLAAESRIRVLSSPQLMVVDNQQARIQVGDQQPVRTGTTTSDGGVITESIQFKDTGVQLEVTPKINAGGLVTLDLDQNVTDVGPIDEATGQRAFLTRQINSRVSVQSGQTIVLGGLIRERSASGSSGLPGLHRLPVLGGLFGNRSNEYGRTELIVLITPQVVSGSDEAVQVASELRERMRNVVPMESPWRQPLQRPDMLHLNQWRGE